jgi:chorismate mutase, putative
MAFASISAWADDVSSELIHSISERLSYMEDVALYKAQKHVPIEDVAREKLVVDESKMSAKESGLDPESIEAFFRAQISVAKAIQYRVRADLLSTPSEQQPKDLVKEVRPALIHLGDEIILGMSKYLEEHSSFRDVSFEEFSTDVNIGYVTESDKRLLYDALLKVAPLAS